MQSQAPPYVLQVLLSHVASWEELQCVTRSGPVNSGSASKQSKSVNACPEIIHKSVYDSELCLCKRNDGVCYLMLITACISECQSSCSHCALQRAWSV